MRDSRGRIFRSGDVAHADDQGAPHRVGDIDEPRNAAPRHQMRGSGVPRGPLDRLHGRFAMFRKLCRLRRRPPDAATPEKGLTEPPQIRIRDFRRIPPSYFNELTKFAMKLRICGAIAANGAVTTSLP